MYISFEDVRIIPNPVNTGQAFVITAKVQVPTYERLEGYRHNTLSRYTHQQLKEDVIK